MDYSFFTLPGFAQAGNVDTAGVGSGFAQHDELFDVDFTPVHDWQILSSTKEIRDDHRIVELSPDLPMSEPASLFQQPTQGIDVVSRQDHIAPAMSMAPPRRPRRKKAPTLRNTDWEPYKDRILDLHATLGLPLGEVKRKIEDEFGFIATYVVHLL